MGADLYLVKLNAEHNYRDSVGYYRDSYNDYNLLWLLGLDYWVWWAKFLNKDRELTPAKARQILTEIERRKHILERVTGFMKTEHSKWFNDKYVELTAFLGKAIELNSKIECSL